jgi:hypothetical protein
MNQSKKKSQKSGFYEFIIIVTTLGIVLSVFQLYVNKLNNQQNLLESQSDIGRAEFLKIFSEGPKNFIPSDKYHMWPGCNGGVDENGNNLSEKLSDYEKGYCDGYSIASDGTWDLETYRGVIYSKYPTLVSSPNDGSEICSLATEPNEWKGSDGSENFHWSEIKSKSEYISGCKLGINSGYSDGQQILKTRNSYAEVPQTPIPTSGDSGGGKTGGYWVSKCRWVQIPNPDYDPSNPSINYRLANPPYLAPQKKCTDTYVPNK